MFRFIEKTKGAISVFLICIMLPVSVLSWLLIDQARLSLAKSRVAAAADITLNTALSQYDNILKEVYGIFATSQNTDEVFNNLEEYYSRNLMIAGLDEESASYLSENIIYMLINMLTDTDSEVDNYADFLATDLLSFSVEKSKTGSVANAEILKEQIVDFMKYRAPIGVGLEFLETIKSLSTVSEQSTVIEKKVEYYDAVSDMEENLMRAWLNIEKYIDTYANAKSGALNEATLTGADGKSGTISKINSKWDYVKEKVPLAVTYTMIIPNAYEMNSGDSIYTHRILPEFGTISKTTTKKVKEYTIESWGGTKYVISNSKLSESGDSKDTDKLVALLDEVKTQIVLLNRNYYGVGGKGYEDYEKKLNESEKKKSTLECLENVMTDIKKAYEDTTYRCIAINAISYMAKMDYSMDFSANFEKLCSSLQNLLDEYSKLTTSKQGKYKEIQTILSNFDTLYDVFEEYNRYRYDLFYEDCFIDEKTYTVKISSAETRTFNFSTTEEKCEELKKTIDTLKKNLTNARTLLVNAKNYLTSAKNMLGSNGAVGKAESAWKTAAENGAIAGTSFSDSNLSEIEVNGQKITQTDINNLITYVQQKITWIDDINKSIDSLKVNGITVNEYTTLVDYYKTISGDINNRDFYLNADFITDDHNYLDRYIKIFSGDKVTVASNVKLEFKDGVPSLFNYLKKNYEGASKKVSEKADEESDAEKEASNSLSGQLDSLQKGNTGEATATPTPAPTSGTATPTPTPVYTGTKINTDKLKVTPKLPSKDSTKTTPTPIDVGDTGKAKKDNSSWKDTTSSSAKTSGTSSNIFGSLLTALKNTLETVRDDLYITEYVMGNFSYKTIEKEALTKCYPPGSSLATRLSYGSFRLYTNSSGGSNKSDKFGITLPSGTSADQLLEKVLKELETLTNVQISPTNNYGYLNEVEYIIFGNNGTSNVDNLIIAIRFILNLIAVFSVTEVTSSAQALATALFAVPFTFLVPIAKIAIIIAVVIGETAIDKKLINAGQEVPLFKNSDTWILSFSGAIDVATGIAVEKAKDVVKDKIGEATTLINGYVQSLNEDADGLLDDATQNIQNSLGGVYDQYVGEYVDEVTNELLYLCNTYLAVEYKSSTFSYENIISKIRANIETLLKMDKLDKNGLEYKVKKKTVDIILSETGTYIEPILKQLDVAGETVTDAQGNVVSAIESIPKNIKSKVMSLVNDTADAANNELKQLKNQMVSKVTDSVNQGGDKLKDASDKFFDSFVDKSSSNQDLSSDAGQAFSLSYSDYLKLFLMIALIADQDGVVLRIADVIQLNMQKMSKNSNYKLSKSYAYIGIKIESEIRPLFMSLEGLENYLNIDNTSDNPIGLSRYYKFNYSQRSGY